MSLRRCFRAVTLAALLVSALEAQAKRKVIINEDASGPGGSNMQTILLMLQSPQVDVLGITIVSGDQWRDEELQHTLRLLELVGRTDVPVMAGAGFPLLRTRDEARAWQSRFGKVTYAGAWDDRWYHAPYLVPPLAEGQPKTKPANEDAAHFLVRTVHQYPGEVTIYEGGPMTNLATAITLDAHFPELAQELVFMGGSLNPDAKYPEFADNPRHEFNFWFDPEAAEIVLRAPWKKIVCTPTDISIKTRLSPELVAQIGGSQSAAAQYVKHYYLPGPGNDFMWDELAAAAWIDPTLITEKTTKYMGVDIDRGGGYGNTLTSDNKDASELSRTPVEVNVEVDTQRFYDMFKHAMQTPRAH